MTRLGLGELLDLLGTLTTHSSKILLSCELKDFPNVDYCLQEFALKLTFRIFLISLTFQSPLFKGNELIFKTARTNESLCPGLV